MKCVCMCVYIYIYIYIQRERERERERFIHVRVTSRFCFRFWSREKYKFQLLWLATRLIWQRTAGVLCRVRQQKLQLCSTGNVDMWNVLLSKISTLSMCSRSCQSKPKSTITLVLPFRGAGSHYQTTSMEVELLKASTCSRETLVLSLEYFLVRVADTI